MNTLIENRKADENSDSQKAECLSMIECFSTAPEFGSRRTSKRIESIACPAQPNFIDEKNPIVTIGITLGYSSVRHNFVQDWLGVSKIHPHQELSRQRCSCSTIVI
jgi:hypothetical protein